MLRGTGIQSFLEVFSLDHPNGERREIGSSDANELKAFRPKGAVILTAEDLQAAENATLDAVFAATVAPAGSPVSQSSLHAEFSPSGIS